MNVLSSIGSQTSSALLALAVLVATWFTIKCITPPNGTSKKVEHKYEDRITRSLRSDWSSSYLFKFSIILTVVFTVTHAAVTLTYPDPPRSICPRPHILAKELFTWSWNTTLCLTTIVLAAMLRLNAYKTLGRSFTFELNPPKGGLVTTGVYSYVQHPSYTGLILLLVAFHGLFLRLDGGIISCWLPHTLVGNWYVRCASYIAGLVWTAIFLALRIPDEEAMMRNLFGKEWEDWHRKTARFLPFLF
ncbi:MAG: hypothetical protein M1824_003922 [Vezdaea acicularis]|nr:MAG: hypothetical protein M1824_003922 [Vezdaea acicularis]